MGGAVTADVEDFSANYYNPAGLARGDQLRISMGWYGAVHDLRINGASSNVDPLHGGAEAFLTLSNLLIVLGFSREPASDGESGPSQKGGPGPSGEQF